MYLFPSSSTRDITWLLGSLSVSFVYIAFRFMKPETLLRPDSQSCDQKWELRNLRNDTPNRLPLEP